MRLTVLIGFLLAVLSRSAPAEVAVPPLFGDGMVLQRGMRLPFWGTAAPGETVTIHLAASTAQTTADSSGQWRIGLAPVDATGPCDLVISGSNTLIFRDVLLGEVWLAAGQSNMAWEVGRLSDARDFPVPEIPARLRQFTVQRAIAETPLSNLEGYWQVCSPDALPHFSAVAFSFSREIEKELNVPVGWIVSAWGGTPAEAWTPRSALEEEIALKPLVDYWNHEIISHSPLAAAPPGIPAGNQLPADPRRNPWLASGLFNGMVYPLAPYAIRGVVWYQGEANTHRAWQYRTLFPALIRSWRQAWGQGDFPFLFVQLPNWGPITADPDDSNWAELREAQRLALSVPNTGMAVTLDIGEEANVHPENKREVGNRLARLALAKVYGRAVVGSGPLYESMSMEGNLLRVRFRETGEGLRTTDGKPPTGFAISGANREFRWAEAELQGDSVCLHHANMSQPVAVRYAWAHNPTVNLVNSVGLPASPFRTDDWPGLTEGVEDVYRKPDIWILSRFWRWLTR